MLEHGFGVYIMLGTTLEGIFDKNPDFWWYTVVAMNNSITLI
jgi:hypothetical protein